MSRTDLVGYLVGYPEPIWYDAKGVTNILPMALIQKKIMVPYGKETCFMVDKGGISKR